MTWQMVADDVRRRADFLLSAERFCGKECPPPYVVGYEVTFRS